jgi:hypothetical protein
MTVLRSTTLETIHMVDANRRMLLMPRRKKSDTDRHLTRTTTLRFRPELREALEELSDRNATNLNDEIRRAVREYLQREGLWPRPPDASKPAKG